METMEVKRRKLKVMPFDHGFYTKNGNWELCHATGWEVSDDGEWGNEYVDCDGNLHYGR